MCYLLFLLVLAAVWDMIIGLLMMMLALCSQKLQLFFGAMQPQELERIRMLENRMRRPSKAVNPTNEESLKSIKSTDSKKMIMPLFKLQEEPHEETPHPIEQLQHIRLSEEEIKANRKITDYFKVKKNLAPPPQQEVSPIPVPAEIVPNPLPVVSQNNKSPLREREQLLTAFRTQIVQSTIELHRLRRNELKLRVSHNKQRLGEHRIFHTEKGNTQMWIDGTEIKYYKRKLDQIKKSKESLDKTKRQARRGKDQEENQQWRITLNSQSYFLSRQESYCEEMLKRLEEEKAAHIKQYRLLYEEDNSKYGRLVAMGTHAWPPIRKYQLLGLLGKGGFSEVYKGYDTEQLREVAVKIHEFNPKWNTQAKDNYIKHALRQNSVHKMLSHPNIVRLYDTVEIDPNSFCTVLQFCEGPDLSFYLKKYKKIPQKEAKLIIRQVISAIRYLHQLPDKVIHYDLKPQNIVFHKGMVKITDFGLCKITKEDTIELTSQGVGTYWYLPPECFQEEKTLITPKVDVWSIGVIYFEMLYGQKPFGNAMSQMRILKQGIMLKANTVNFPNTQKGIISQESKQFIRECLEFKSQQRLDIHGVANHKIFEKR